MRRLFFPALSLAIIPVLAACGGGAGTTPPVSSPPTPSSTFVVSPAVVTIGTFTHQQFTAYLNGQATNAVAWKVNGTTGGSLQFGFISLAGLYSAPGGVPTKSTGPPSNSSDTTTLTVTAVLTATPAISASATVTLLPINQSTQTVAIKMGTSGGNTKDITGKFCCSGTLGSLVARGGTQYILSNNHVLALNDRASVGDPIGQPGLIEANCDASSLTTVAKLSEFFNLESGPVPKIDAAIAQVEPGGHVDSSGNVLYLGSTATNGIPDPGAPHAGTGMAASVGQIVAKSGRSTGLTCSRVMAIDTTTSVEFQKGCGSATKFTVQFTKQVDIEGGSFSANGDSGSLVVTQSTADPVGLLFAGSDTDTVANPVSDVLQAFASGGNNVTFVGGGPHSVIGCTLPSVPLSAATAQSQPLAAESLRKAAEVRDAHGPELLGHPEVQAVGVGASYDNPAEPAVLFFVTKGQPRTNLPTQVDGIRTRIIERDLFERRGKLSESESVGLEQSVLPPQVVSAISNAEVGRAKVVHAMHIEELMKQPGVQGVGITSSVDSPGEAALMIFVTRGVEHGPIPAVIDDLRTRVRESSRFRGSLSGGPTQRGCVIPGARMATNRTSATLGKR